MTADIPIVQPGWAAPPAAAGARTSVSCHRDDGFDAFLAERRDEAADLDRRPAFEAPVSASRAVVGSTGITGESADAVAADHFADDGSGCPTGGSPSSARLPEREAEEEDATATDRLATKLLLDQSSTVAEGLPADGPTRAGRTGSGRAPETMSVATGSDRKLKRSADPASPFEAARDAMAALGLVFSGALNTPTSSADDAGMRSRDEAPSRADRSRGIAGIGRATSVNSPTVPGQSTISVIEQATHLGTAVVGSDTRRTLNLDAGRFGEIEPPSIGGADAAVTASEIRPHRPVVIDQPAASRPQAAKASPAAEIIAAVEAVASEANHALCDQVFEGITRAIETLDPPATATELRATAAEPAFASRIPVRSLKLQLAPEALGLLTVSVVVRDATLRVQLDADRKSTAEIVGREKAILSDRLEVAGYNVEQLLVGQIEQDNTPTAANDSPTAARERTESTLADRHDGARDGRSSDANERSRPEVTRPSGVDRDGHDPQRPSSGERRANAVRIEGLRTFGTL